MDVAKCPKCGRSIPVQPYEVEVVCPQCGSTYRIRRHAVPSEGASDAAVQPAAPPPVPQIVRDGAAGLKACPFCGELIYEDAIKCRFCGEFLDGSGRPAEEAVPPERESRYTTLRLSEPLEPEPRCSVAACMVAVFAGILVASFFAPWFDLASGRVSGIDLPSRLELLLADSSGHGQGAGLLCIVFIVLPLAMLGGLMACSRLPGKRGISSACGWVSLGVLAVFVSFFVIADRGALDVFQKLSIGFYGAAAGALGMGIAALFLDSEARRRTAHARELGRRHFSRL